MISLPATATAQGQDPAPKTAVEETGLLRVAAIPGPRRIFISGHSLTNEPLPSDLAAIAERFGYPVNWNRQHIDGSSIRDRSRGGGAGNNWEGYSRGIDRKNQPIDVLSEFRRPERHPEAPYDALVITEQHGLLHSLAYQDTVRYLRHFHDRFIDHNKEGLTYFYEPWLSLNDKNDPRSWIAYEQGATRVWRCVAARVNMSLAGEGRTDRIKSIPAAHALADLIGRATRQPGLPGVSRPTIRETVDSLIADDVHLTDLGSYYVALVTFAYVFRHSPLDAWSPADVTPGQAHALQEAAADFASRQSGAADTMSLDECRAFVRGSFLWTYLSYFEKTYWRKEANILTATLRRLKLSVQWRLLFFGDGPGNPLANPSRAKAG